MACVVRRARRCCATAFFRRVGVAAAFFKAACRRRARLRAMFPGEYAAYAAEPERGSRESVDTTT